MTSETENDAHTAHFAQAIQAAKASPDDMDLWDALEELAEETQQPDAVGLAYRETLGSDLSLALVDALGQRAVSFHEAWFAEDSPHLREALSAVLTRDPSSDWALQRITVVLTVSEAWNALLDFYDRALKATHSDRRREELLEQAAQLAKDFAGEPDRAIDYLHQLWPLRASDAQVYASLERLLERQGRWQELIALWRQRLDVLSPADNRALRLRISRCHLEHLQNADAALDELRQLVDEGESDAENFLLLEEIVGLDSCSDDTRAGALGLLRDAYQAASRDEDIVSVLQVALRFAEGTTKYALHHELGDRLATASDVPQAMVHFSACLLLQPTSTDAQDRLAELAERDEAYGAYVDALVAASEVAEPGARQDALRLDAAERASARLNDNTRAIALLQKIMAGNADVPVKLAVGRRLEALLDQTDQKEACLAVLEHLSRIEIDPVERRRLMGRSARLAAALGDAERALQGWHERLREDAHDLEALEAIVEITEAQCQWSAHVDALHARVGAPVSPLQRRRDLSRIANTQAAHLEASADAIATWRQIQAQFGEDAETVDALFELLSVSGEHDELRELLVRAAQRDASRAADMLARLGDVCRQFLSRTAEAANAYHRAVEMEPGLERALAGLRALLEDTDAREGAIRALSRAYRLTDNKPALADLLEERLEIAEDDHERVALLEDKAAFCEATQNDLAAAFESLCRALGYQPANLRLEREVVRLGEAAGRMSDVTDALGAAARVLSDADPERAAALRQHQASLLEQAGQSEDALRVWFETVALLPREVEIAGHALRVAVGMHDWSAAARAFLALSMKRGEVVTPLLDALAQGAREADRLQDAASALSEALPSVGEVDAELGREIDTVLAGWFLECEPAGIGAERALLRALQHQPNRMETLTSLARVQWQRPGKPLIETLLNIAELNDADLDPLFDAARTAVDPVEDSDLARSILERLLRASRRLWEAGKGADGSKTPAEMAMWSLDELVSLALASERAGDATDLLVDGARMPVSPERSQDYRRRAAELARDSLGDEERSLRLLQSVVSENVGDSDAVQQLATLLESRLRLPELLALRQQQLGLDLEDEPRLRVRLEVARVLDLIEERGGQTVVLQDNLRECPGHQPSIDGLVRVLTSRGRFVELTQQLRVQAEAVESLGEAPRAAQLWTLTASIFEEELVDVDAAIGAYGHVVRLEANHTAYDALARLHLARGEASESAGWLRRRLDAADEGEWSEVAMSLADMLLRAGEVAQAIPVFERVLAATPTHSVARAQLTQLHREAGNDEALARLLAEGAEYLEDTAAKLDCLREAAYLYEERLGRLDEAIPFLQQGVVLAPTDQGFKRRLSAGFRAAGRLDEAREVLREMIAVYGRRRSSERAAIHFELAEVAHGAGELKEAIQELELARKMDMSHPGILRMSAELAHEAGELDRAEKAYRALLLVVRRQDPGAPDILVGAAEVLFELSSLATEQGRDAQAVELLETALATAAKHDAETERFVRVLLAKEKATLALRAIDMRLEAVDSDDARARNLAQRADLLVNHLSRTDEGLDAILRAVELSPRHDAYHSEARRLSGTHEATPRYVACLQELLDGARRKEEQEFSSRLLLRLGQVTEEDLRDLDAASEIFQRVEHLGIHALDAWWALARVADAQGNAQEEIRVLRQVISAVPETEVGVRADALYRLAEVELIRGFVEEGMGTLEHALKIEPRHLRASVILQNVDAGPEHVDAVLALYERVARASHDAALILDMIERRCATDAASLALVKEGVGLADAEQAERRAEKLLERGVEVALAQDEGLADALWLATSLAERRERAEDFSAAIRWLKLALEHCHEDDRRSLVLKLSVVAAAEGGELELAAQMYRELLREEPTDRSLWEPLSEVYGRLGDRQEFEQLVQETVDALLDPDDRNAMRMLYGVFLLERCDAEAAGVAVLKQILEEDPDHMDATSRLSEIFAANQDVGELVELLQRSLDRARDRDDAEAVAALSLKMGRMVHDEDSAAAADFYRGGLDWVSTDPELLRALLSLFGSQDDTDEQADLMERLLSVSEGESSVALANDLVMLRQEMEDETGIIRALSLGFGACPSDASLRARLEEALRAQEQWAELAEMMMHDATHREDDERAVSRYREAAQIHRERLSSPAAAANVLQTARTRFPMRLDLLTELVGDHETAGQLQEASAAVGEVLAMELQSERERAGLLVLRARLAMGFSDLVRALTDLEEAYRLDATASASALVHGLKTQLRLASEQGDAELERGVAHRLASVLAEAGEHERAREVWLACVARDVRDRVALQQLLETDSAAERWLEVAGHYDKLIQIQEGAAQLKSALGLRDAFHRLERAHEARTALEYVLRLQPDALEIRTVLRELYEATDAHRELAILLLQDAERADHEEQRFELLRRGGELLVNQVGDTDAALIPLTQALQLRPDDAELAMHLADAYIGSNRLQEAVDLIQTAIGGFKRRRSPLLAGLQLRMARVAALSGDASTQKDWLNVALDADKNNGVIAAELAQLALQMGDDDAALKALRVVTLQKTPGPISKAEAFLRQAQIAHRQGDSQKAILWGRRARLEDDSLQEAHEFLRMVGDN